MFIVLDIETYSPVSLKRGPGRYCQHPDARVVCLSYAVLGSLGHVQYTRSVKGHEASGDAIIELVIDNPRATWVAHNASFERIVLTQFFGAFCKPTQWYCTMAHALLLSLPAALGNISKVLPELAHHKDIKGGDKVVGRLKTVGKTGETYGQIISDEPFMDDAMKYCMDDVMATVAVFNYARRIGAWSAHERSIYHLTQRINGSGVLLDKVSIDLLKVAISEHKLGVIEKVTQLTDGRMTTPRQTKVLNEILASEGIELPNKQRDTIEDFLKENENKPSLGMHLLRLRVEASHPSAKKYDAYSVAMGEDNRLREGFLYYGAHTGRWTSEGAQLHSLKKGIDSVEKASFITNLEGAIGGATFLPDASSLVRNMIVAPKGKLLNILDYGTIEPRCIINFTGSKTGIEDLKGDIYLTHASIIYEDHVIDKEDPRRILGKTSVIGMSYGMGEKRFNATAESAFGEPVPRPLTDRARGIYLTRYPEMPCLWSEIHRAVLKCFSEGIRKEGSFFVVDGRNKNNLTIQLPSGSVLHYPQPMVRLDWVTPLDGEPFQARNFYYHHWVKIKKQWITSSVSPGKFTENIIQRLARDILADGMLKLEKEGFKIIMHIHDEIVCEERGNRLAEMQEILAEMPVWCPKTLKVPTNGFVKEYYDKG